MKKIIRQSIAATVAFFTLFLTACIDVKQDIWINDDGSGKFVFDLGLSKQFKAMMEGFGGLGDLEGLGGLDGAEKEEPEEEKAEEESPLGPPPEKVVKELKASEYVTSAEFKEVSDAKYERTIYTIELSDVTKIPEVMETSSLGNSLQEIGGENKLAEDNEFTIKKTDAGTYELYSIMKGNPEEQEDPAEAEFAAAMMKQMFGDASMTLRVHSPAVSHNGKEKDGAIVWTMLLADIAGGKSLEAKGEFKGGASTKEEEPVAEEPKAEEPEAEQPVETVTVEESKGPFTITNILLGLIALIGIILIARKK